MRDGCGTRPAAEERQRDVDLVGRRRVVGRGVEGVQQKRRALQDVHDVLAVRGAREDVQEALRELAAAIDARLEVVQLLGGGQRARHEQVGRLLVAEAVLLLSVVDEDGDVVAAVDQVALVGDHAVGRLVVTVDVRDGSEANEHAGAVGVAQAALDVVLGIKLGGNDVNALKSLVQAVGDIGASESDRGHRVGIGHVRQSRGLESAQDGSRAALAVANDSHWQNLLTKRRPVPALMQRETHRPLGADGPRCGPRGDT